MKRKTAALTISLLTVIIIVSGIVIVVQSAHKKQEIEQKIQEYTGVLENQLFIGQSSNKTVSHGTAQFTYRLTLNGDGTCELAFSYFKNDDNSIFSSNKADRFPIDVSTWSVGYEKEEDEYYLFLSGGDWDWKEYSAAKLSRTFSIRESGDELNLIGLREKTADVYFRCFSE